MDINENLLEICIAIGTAVAAIFAGLINFQERKRNEQMPKMEDKAILYLDEKLDKLQIELERVLDRLDRIIDILKDLN